MHPVALPHDSRFSAALLYRAFASDGDGMDSNYADRRLLRVGRAGPGQYQARLDLFHDPALLRARLRPRVDLAVGLLLPGRLVGADPRSGRDDARRQQGSGEFQRFMLMLLVV